MAPSQLKKRLNRALLVSWREQPTRYDVAALQANIRRVGLVVRVRWALVVVLVVYSAIAGTLYTNSTPLLELVRLMVVPAVALVFVVLYNTYYTLNYRRLGSIAVWNNVQLALDALVVTVLLYFSGGVNSWFWTIYALFIFEAAFILPRSRDVWLHAILSVALIGVVEFSEMLGWLPHVVIPFTVGDSYGELVFVLVRYFWQVAMLAGAAWVSVMLVGEFRREIDSRNAHSLVDEETGLFSRAYFTRALRTEMRRAQRDDRSLHVMLIDIDRFGEFNARFGIDVGDRLIVEFATALNSFVGASDPEQPTTNVAARLGGEEFAVLLAENTLSGAALSCDDAEIEAGKLGRTLSEIRVQGAGVTVSIGIACRPEDGVTCTELLDASDDALAAAIEAGGNRVVSAVSRKADTDERSDSETGG